jgi:sarcosine oxidase gamma subunit
VPELREGAVRVTGVFASPEACERVAAEPDAHRIAPEEAMLLGDVPEDLEAAVRELDPDALVLDVSDGWTLLELVGPDAREAFARISELELPGSGFVQGEVARVGVRVLVDGDRLRLLVPAMWTEHVRERILADAAELLR